MSDKTINKDDKMIEAQLKEKADILNISVDDLIERYLKRELFIDDYYVPPTYTKEELLEMSKKDVEKDKKRGFYPRENNFDVFINRWSEDED